MRQGLWLRLALNLAIHLPRLVPPHLAKTRSYKLLSLGSVLAATIGGSCDLHSIAEHRDPGTLRPENHGACELSHQTTGSHPPPCHLHMPPLSSPKCLVVCTSESLSSALSESSHFRANLLPPLKQTVAMAPTDPLPQCCCFRWIS